MICIYIYICIHVIYTYTIGAFYVGAKFGDQGSLSVIFVGCKTSVLGTNQKAVW